MAQRSVGIVAHVLATGLGELFADDAVAWMASQPSASVDLVFADPPYNAGRESWDSFADQSPAEGVTIWPTSGTVDQGLSSTIQVEGTFDKAKKFFYVMVVSRAGSTGYSVKFTCQ